MKKITDKKIAGKEIVHLSKDDIGTKVKEVLADILNISTEKISPKSAFEELGIDSFEGLLILVAIEKKFNIIIDRDESSSIKTFGELLQLIKKCLEKKIKNG